jgi:MFS transporter, UMF1 family
MSGAERRLSWESLALAHAQEEAGDAQTDVALPAEVNAYYTIDFANSVFSTVGISGFLPLLLQSSAAAAAGFPLACPNVITNATTIAAVWPFDRTVDATALYIIAGAGPRACETNPLCRNGVCAGLPSSMLDCRSADGKDVVPLRATSGPFSIDPTAYATLSISLSVLLQALAFLLLGAAADYGKERKRYLLRASWLGAAGCLCCVLIRPSLWWMGMLLAVLTNVCFGVTSVLYNAFLPLIVFALPKVRNAAAADRHEVAESMASELSSKGFAWGFVAGVLGILLCLPLVITLPEGDAYRGAMVVCGLWWGIFMLVPARHLKERPGPPLPPNSTLFSQSLATARQTFRELKKAPTTAYYLLLWSLFSDGVFVIGLLGGLFAAKVEWACFPLGKTFGILCVFLVVPFAAAIGNVSYLALAKRMQLPPRRMLIIALLSIGLVVPMWGWVGLKTGEEVILLAAWYGLHMAPMQAFSRALFASLIPTGQESAFFSLYELTNRGSSWLGPLILTVTQEATGSTNIGFAYVFLVVCGGALGLSRLNLAAAAPRGELVAQDAAAVVSVRDDAGPHLTNQK